MREVKHLKHARTSHGAIIIFDEGLAHARRSSATRRIALSNPPSLAFPEWVPPAVIEAAKELNEQLATEKDSTKALEVLSRLVSHPLMARVWREIFRKKRVRHKPTEEYLNPAFTYKSRVAAYRQKASELRKKGGPVNEREAESCEAEASYLEAEATLMENEFDPLAHLRWTRQERAAQILLSHVYRGALDNEPVFLSSLIAKTKDLRKLVEELRAGVKIVESHKLNLEASKLKELAEEIEDEADNADPLLDPRTGQQLTSPRFPHVDDPWVIVRETPDVQMRSFVIGISITTLQLFGTPLYHTLANITNVVFGREDVTANRVRELLQARPET
jgi:hypothetical protein